MEKTLKKNILTLPTDSLPVRTKKAIAVTQAADGTVTNIEAVYPDGKRVDLDGNVQGTKSVTITANDTYTVSPDATYTSLRLAVVSVAVPTPEPVLETLNATANNTYTPTSPAVGFSSVSVAVAPVQLTQAQYDALTTKDPNTIYAILG